MVFNVVYHKPDSRFAPKCRNKQETGAINDPSDVREMRVKWFVTSTGRDDQLPCYSELWFRVAQGAECAGGTMNTCNIRRLRFKKPNSNFFGKQLLC